MEGQFGFFELSVIIYLIIYLLILYRVFPIDKLFSLIGAVIAHLFNQSEAHTFQI